MNLKRGTRVVVKENAVRGGSLGTVEGKVSGHGCTWLAVRLDAFPRSLYHYPGDLLQPDQETTAPAG